MTWQDLVALAICALAAGWLIVRLARTHGPARPARRGGAGPDVTTGALLKKTRERRADRPGCH